MCRCQECGRDYKTDILVSNALWEGIKPPGKPDGSGLLCPGCVGRKIELLGGYKVFDLIAKGETDDELSVLQK